MKCINLKQLKGSDQRKHLKINAKKYVTGFNKQRKITGGGKALVEPDDMSATIMELLQGELDLLDNPFDDDVHADVANARLVPLLLLLLYPLLLLPLLLQ